MPYHVGDTTPPLKGKLSSDGQPVNLTGATLSVHVRKPDRSVLIISATGGADGIWTAPWPGPIEAQGTHRVEVQVTYSDGQVQTFGPASLGVQPQVA